MIRIRRRDDFRGDSGCALIFNGPAARSGCHSIENKGYLEKRCCVGIAKGNIYATIWVI